MITLEITQEIKTQEDLMILALALKYEATVEKETTEEMTVERANEESLTIKKVWEDEINCIALISVEDIVNPVTAKEYIEQYFRAKNVAEWVSAVVSMQKALLAEKRAEEDKEIEESVNTKIV